MRAMVLEKQGEPLVLRELADPSPLPGELLVRVLSCGVCRTDLQIAEGDLAAHKIPIVPGHQIVGIAENDAGAIKAGERVGVAWLGGTCGKCRFCAEARENLCEQASFTGWDRDGGYAIHAIVRGDFAFPVPEGPPHESIAPLLCGGVIGYRALRVSGVQPGQRLGLFGFGASALLAIQIAVFWKCEVYVFTRSTTEQERAKAMGAIWAGSYDDKPPVPLHAAVTFAPVGSVVVKALQTLDRGGAVAVNAIHLDRIPELSYDDLWWERSIRSVANFTRDDARTLLDLAAQIPIRTTYETFLLDQANLALRRHRDGQIDGAAVIVP